MATSYQLGFEDYNVASEPQPSHQELTGGPDKKKQKQKLGAASDTGQPRPASADAAEAELQTLKTAASRGAGAEEPALPGETSFVDKVGG